MEHYMRGCFLFVESSFHIWPTHCKEEQQFVALRILCRIKLKFKQFEKVQDFKFQNFEEKFEKMASKRKKYLFNLVCLSGVFFVTSN